ncbi:MAG: hypothetical protein HY674_00960 [Chloroflexi bacterium]|nr:hypothetical protein [Chloroflexota bacterium]
MRSLGIDAVWIPPTCKGNGATGSVGYDIFDHYDLGDKYQKGATPTRFSNKDEFLQSVAVRHANDMEVMQDIIWNHLMGAEWQDFNATDDKWKEFRYVSYATPVTINYGSRTGRFLKNGQNFHRCWAHNNNWEETTQAVFGQDVCFWDGAYGQSSSPTDYDPVQSSQYIWCHQKLNFKDGAYQVRWTSPDLFIIERSGRAVIRVSDHWTQWQAATI